MSTRRLAAAALLAALVVAAWHLPGELRRWDNLAAAADARSRELPAASLFGIDPAAFGRAARLLPRDAVFYVATPKRGGLPALAFPNLAAGSLLPRRRTLDLRQAGWIVAFRADPRKLGVPVQRVVRLANGVRAAEVAR